MIEIHSNATIYTVVPCKMCGPIPGEADAEHREAEYISDDLKQAAVVCEALNLRHSHQGKKETFCIESSNKNENMLDTLADVEVEPSRVVEYMVNEMGIEKATAKKWVKPV